MKTTLKERLNTAAIAIQTQGQKAFKHPITSIFSLCLVAGIAATIAGFSQAPTAPAEPAATPTAVAVSPNAGTTLPTPRTLTSADGRTIDVTILSKSDTAIKAARADGKEFEITLDKLSDADRAFVAGLVDAPVKKMKALVIGRSGLISGMEKAGFEITILNKKDELQTINDQELESFDAVIASGPSPSRSTQYSIQVARLIKLTHDEKIIAWQNYYKTDKRKFIKEKIEPTLFKGSGLMRDKEPFIDIQGNTIFFSPTKYSDKTDNGEIINDAIFDQVIVELKKLIQRKNSIQKQPNN